MRTTVVLKDESVERGRAIATRMLCSPDRVGEKLTDRVRALWRAGRRHRLMARKPRAP